MDIITNYVRKILNNNDIVVLEEISGNDYNEGIIHYYDQSRLSPSSYIIINYNNIDEYLRIIKLKKIKNNINGNKKSKSI